jgi:GPH family glycoside/pentoside/hexuronide:cation symporter
VMGFGYIFVGPFLDIIGLEATMAPGAVPESILTSIGIVIGPVMTIILVIPLWMVSRLGVSRERSREVQAALRSRQLGESAT